MTSALAKLKAAARFAHGTSKAAARRRAEADRGNLFYRAPGGIFRTSDGKRYIVAPDGSFRRLKEVKA